MYLLTCNCVPLCVYMYTYIIIIFKKHLTVTGVEYSLYIAFLNDSEFLKDILGIYTVVDFSHLE